MGMDGSLAPLPVNQEYLHAPRASEQVEGAVGRCLPITPSDMSFAELVRRGSCRFPALRRWGWDAAPRPEGPSTKDDHNNYPGAMIRRTIQWYFEELRVDDLRSGAG